jgi:hypothetical protein
MFERNQSTNKTPFTMCSVTNTSKISSASINTLANLPGVVGKLSGVGFGGKKTYKKRPPIRRGKKSRKSKK